MRSLHLPILLLVCLVCHVAAQEDLSFLTTPGKITVRPGETATLDWLSALWSRKDKYTIYTPNRGEVNTDLECTHSVSWSNHTCENNETRVVTRFAGNTTYAYISFNLNNVTLEDAGTYCCEHFIDYYKQGYEDCSGEIEVLDPPGPATIAPLSGPLIAGENPAVELMCDVSNPGIPAGSFRWFKDGQPLYGGDTGVYTIPAGQAAVWQHDGVWTCTAYNVAGEGDPGTVTVTVNERPRLSIDLPAQAVVVANDDSSFNIRCGFVSKPAAEISWTYEGSTILPDTVRVTDLAPEAVGQEWLASQTLSWLAGQTPVRSQAAGSYKCHATVQLNDDTQDSAASSEMTLVVEYAPRDVSLTGPARQTVVAGQDSISQTCTAQCNPSCDYQWTDSQNNVVSTGGLLTFDPVQKSDHGAYSCVATNKHDSLTTEQLTVSFSVFVNYAPEIMDFGPSVASPMEGSGVSLVCNVDSRPGTTAVNIQTESNNVLITAVGQRATYAFSSVQCLDTGDYYCTADNGVGSPVRQTTFLNVVCPVTPAVDIVKTQTSSPGGDVTFSSHVITANPFPTLTWTFTPDGSTVAAALPNNVQSRLLETGSVQRIVVLEVTEVKQTGNYGWYQATAGNQHGAAVEIRFQLSAATVGTPAPSPSTAPSAPVLVRATAVSLEIEWMAGNDGGSQQTFTVFYREDNSLAEKQQRISSANTAYSTGDVITHKLDNLEGATTYVVWIKAENAQTVVEGPTAELSTKALPSLDSSSVTIDKEENVAIVTLDIQNSASVSKFTIELCGKRTKRECTTKTTMLNAKKRCTKEVVIDLPTSEPDSLSVDVKMYDGDDLVYMKTWQVQYEERVQETEVVTKGKEEVYMGVMIAIILLTVVGLCIWCIDRRCRNKKSNGRERFYQNDVELSNNTTTLGTAPGSDKA